MDSKQRFEKHLPHFLTEYAEFSALAEIEGEILEQEAAGVKALDANQWIETANRSGLLRRANMLGIQAEEEETEALRERIFYLWRSRSPYTYYSILEWLQESCGQTQVDMIVEPSHYRVTVKLEIPVQKMKEDLEKKLRGMIPANMLLYIGIQWNSHAKLNAYTHGSFTERGFTYGEMATRVLEEATEANEE